MRLSSQQFGALVEQALKDLPEEFARHMQNVVVEVMPRPTAKVLADAGMGPDEVDELLGFYDGVPLTEKSVDAPFEYPERILIFQANIEAVCRTRKEIVQEVRRTVLHEIGHHFGMDEDDLEELGYG